MMGSYVKKIISVSLGVSLLTGSIPISVHTVRAEETAGMSGLDEIAAQAGEDDDSFAPEEGYRLGSRSAKPSSFDLRNVGGKGYVTEVKVQNPYGACWGFGAIAAAESSIIGSGLTDADSLDLSEKQVAWFVADTIHDQNSPQCGEGMAFADGITAQDRYDAGGVTALATNLFASGTGPTAENASTDDGLIFRYSGRAGLVNHERVSWYDNSGNEHTGYKAISYSEDDDWSIPEKYRFVQDFALRESVVLPSPGEMEDLTEIRDVTEAIKEQLLKKRAVAINYHATTYTPSQTTAFSDFMGENWAQYDDSGNSSTHVVTIVGYDDNYPKSNFVLTPPGDGAWLVKNSWGSDLNDFPNNGYRHFGIFEGQDNVPYDDHAQAASLQHTGYFWLSYYDTTIRNPESYVFEKANPDTVINQHDFMPVTEYVEFATEAANRTANVFTASKAQKLTDISIFTTTPGTEVSYEIYILPENAKNPADGVKAAGAERLYFPYGGYHKLALAVDQPVYLGKGQKFSVIVTEQTPSGKYSISLPTSSSEENIRGGRFFRSVVNKGESYLFIDGSWIDLSDNTIKSRLKYGGWGICFDNFSIKAYSVPSDTGGAYLEIKKQSGTTVSSLDMNQRDSMKLTASIRGGTGELPEEPVIRWEASDPELFSISVTDGGSKAEIVPTKAGSGCLIVDAGIFGRKVIGVTVHRFLLHSADLSESSARAVYTGKPYEPELETITAETKTEEYTSDLSRDVDYTLTYEKNTLCGMGEVIVTGIGSYEGELRPDMYNHLSFVILPAKARILKVTPGNGELTVTFETQKDSGIDGYVLTCKEAGTEQEKTQKVSKEAASAVIKGLSAGKTYEVRLKAYVTTEEKDVYNPETDDYEDVSTDNFGEVSDAVVCEAKAGGESTVPADGSPSDPTSAAGTEKAVAAISNDGDLPGSSFGTLRFRALKVTKNSIKLTWKHPSGADGFILYGNRCGRKYRFKKLTEFGKGKTAWTQKKLKKGTYYKYLLVAYKMVNGTKKVIASSKTVHAATGGGKVGNYKSLKLNKTKVSLKKGESFLLKVTPVPASGKLKVKKHRAAAFESSNKKVAAVSAKGKIKAKKKGTCTVYVYAQNGCFKTVKVTVK